MDKKISITDAELDVMKVLWTQGECTSTQILAKISGSEERNRNTVKTLLLRLVQKGAVEYDEINLRTYKYRPIITESEYAKCASRGFLNKVFGGSSQKMLLNFVKDEKITKEDLQRLMDIIEEDE